MILRKRLLLIWVSTLTILLLACGGLAAPQPARARPTAWELPATWTASPTITITPSITPSPTETLTVTPSQTLTPTLTPTLTAYLRGPDEITIPILLYHHIGVSPQGDTVYYLAPESFERQMNLLSQWGYKTISVELLAKAIREGAELPPRPIILTFDDGSETVYTKAMPIMQKYGFTGTAYIVYNYMWVPRYMDVDQVKALHAAGWEIGSHGTSHTDLPSHPGRQENEIVGSRRKLQAKLDVPVLSFSYPFGTYDKDSLYFVHYAGYSAAVGLGKETLQGQKNLFYLYRQPVKGTDDLATFAALLPWQDDMTNLPIAP
ncbi:MAG: polysaccharide deacetylase family protein [Chloroflexota bacterium]|nr:polysaccharide deacetylase family protein [Anaerolineales bacterium]